MRSRDEAFDTGSVVPQVASAVVDAVIAHARDAAPEECCGILLGAGAEIVDSRRARNIADVPKSRFLIDPKDHIDARRDGRRRGIAVVGFYHSHPRSAATPSDTDVAEAAYPDHVHLIVGFASGAPEVRLFRMDTGGYRELDYHVG